MAGAITQAAEGQAALRAARQENEALRRELSVLREAHGRVLAERSHSADLLESVGDSLAGTAPPLLWVTDASGACTFLSRSWSEYTGQTEEAGMGFGWLDVVHPDDRAHQEEAFLQANERGESFRLDFRLRRRDGVYRWIIAAGWPRYVDDGTFLGYVGSVIDIHDRKQAEEALRESEARFRALFEAIDEGFCLCEIIVDEEGQPVDYRFLEVNPLFEEMTGLVDATGRTAHELVPNLEPHWVETYARVALGGEAFRFESGSDAMGRWFDVFATPVKPQGRFALVFKDVTERRRAEQALRQSEARFRATFENAAVGIAHVAPDGSWLRVNERLCDIVGYPREELLALSFQDITHPDDLEADLAFVQQCLNGERDDYEMEKRYLHRDGHTVWIHLTVSVVRQADGAVDHFISIIENIAHRKAAQQALNELTRTLEQQVEARTGELAEANETLQQRNRELQDFAYVASHDLQEPLRKIQAFSDLLRADYGKRLDAQGRDYVDRMESAASRMSALIKALLLFSRIATQGQPFSTLDLNSVAKQVLEDLEIRIKEAQAQVEIGVLPQIEADPTQMHQLLQNLIGNALKFSRAEVLPRVRVSGAVEEDAAGRRWCRLVVEDNGIGFEEKYLDRVFSPFQRLHGRIQYEGTGMGLAICRRIVERHGGTISAESTPGEGSRFTVTLPVALASPVSGQLLSEKT